MKLTKEEYQNLIDSRLVELKASIEEYESGEPIVDNNKNLERLKKISESAEGVYYAYEAKVNAEEEQLAEEAEKEYKKNFMGEELK